MMNRPGKEWIGNVANEVVRLGTFFTLAIMVMIMCIAVFDKRTDGEAPIGSFTSKDLNSDWVMMMDGERSEITLPATVDAQRGDEIILSRELPGNLSNGMSLMVRTAMQDVTVYVDGRLRASYTSNSVKGLSYFLPSAYVVTTLNKTDSGKSISIHLTVKNKGIINGVILSYGNNGWFRVLKGSLPLVIIALFILVCGVVMAIAAKAVGNQYGTEVAGRLGMLIIDISLWLISESYLRQLIFNRPTLSQYFAYITIELVAPLACMYFDAVQHKVYHRRYLVAELIVFIQMVVCVLLDAADVLKLFQTLPINHLLTGLCAILVFVNIITDIRKKRFGSYRISMIGGIFFLATSLMDLVGFYRTVVQVFGTFMCIGLIGLMIATVIQTLYDTVNDYRARERNKTAMTVNTIETIAGAIDARDEYTGGHSERVGMYAGRLAREMAADYDLSEEDILRIHYIGLVHDIGKIGVADSVLNKSGKLTDEEFSLMRRHTEIGYEIMTSLGKVTEGLLDGIRYHHERFDGGGYPDGLAGTDIPLVARILALADSYDAMTSNRVYRKRLTDEEVRNELNRCSGTQFDPALTEIFVRLIDKGELRANTEDGMAVDKEGRTMSSAKLESRLSYDLLEKVKIIHASHIRMLCYLLKLMEKKGNPYTVLMLSVDTEDKSSIMKFEKAIKEHINPHDVNVKYTACSNVVALYERTPEDTQKFIDAVKETCGDVITETI